MVHIINHFNVSNGYRQVQKLSCMSEKNKFICKKDIYDADGIQKRIDQAECVSKNLKLENAKRDRIIIESAAAKAYFGLK